MAKSKSKYRPPLIEKFLLEFETGLYTITECCKMIDINTGTLYMWKKKYPDFLERFKDAEQQQLLRVKDTALKGLMMLIQNQEVSETFVEFENVKIEDDDPLSMQPDRYEERMVSRREVKKMLLPDTKAVTFALSKLDRANFGDEKKEVTGATPVPVVIIQPNSISLDLPSNFDEEPEITKPETKPETEPGE